MYRKFVCSFIIAMKQNAVYLRNMLIYLMDPHKNGMNDKMVFFSLNQLRGIILMKDLSEHRYKIGEWVT